MPASTKTQRMDLPQEGTNSSLLRETGIMPFPQIPWGGHLCVFYDSKDDLLDACVRWFEAGLAGRECCLWVVCDPVSETEALGALRQRIAGFEEFRSNCQFQITDGDKFYQPHGKTPKAIFSQWQKRLDWALTHDYAGLRAAGITFWSGSHHWKSFLDYESFLDRSLTSKKMVALCLYPIETSSAQEVIEVARVHNSTIVRSQGKWDFLESPDANLAKSEIGRLQEALDFLSKPFPGHEKLTRREYMVLTQIVRGASSKEAARVLGITPRTVDFHRANILKKLRARNIADLVRRVME